MFIYERGQLSKRDGRAHIATRGKADSFSSTPLGKQIEEYLTEFAKDRFLKLSEVSKKGGTRGPKLQMPLSQIMGAGGNEKMLMEGLGYYWEPILYDLQFLEGMRDGIPLIGGAYQKFADFIIDGFTIEHPDPDVALKLRDVLLYDPNLDFGEVIRTSAFELATLGNSYRIPVYEQGMSGPLAALKPVKIFALRKLRDKELNDMGYIQLLHRPSEFLWGVPEIPTFYLKDEVLNGIAYSKDWYAYGMPMMAMLPFIAKMKLQMMRDLAEMLHQHVPRIDIVYTPEEQMSMEQVNTELTRIQSQIAQLGATDNFVHTPDTLFDYKGPLGKAIDFSPTLNYVEHQFFAVLPFAPYLLGIPLMTNPIQAQHIWQLTNINAKYIRERLYVMFYPMLKQMSKDFGSPIAPTFKFNDLDVETQQMQAQTEEYQVQNAAAMRDNGFVEQDDAARHATKFRKGGPVQKAAAPGALPPPVDPNKTPKAAPGSGKVGDRARGPKPANRSAPARDKRKTGKRHEALEVMLMAAEQFFGVENKDEDDG